MVQDKQERNLNRNGNRRGMHPNSQNNILGHQNKNGRPPNKVCITSRQKEKMMEVCPFDAKGRTWLEALAEGGMRQSLNIPTALMNLQDRHEGKVTLTIGGEGGEPIKHTIEVVDQETKQALSEFLNK